MPPQHLISQIYIYIYIEREREREREREENETSFSFIVVIIIEQITGGGGSSGHLLYAVEPMKAL